MYETSSVGSSTPTMKSEVLLWLVRYVKRLETEGINNCFVPLYTEPILVLEVPVRIYQVQYETVNDY